MMLAIYWVIEQTMKADMRLLIARKYCVDVHYNWMMRIPSILLNKHLLCSLLAAGGCDCKLDSWKWKGAEEWN